MSYFPIAASYSSESSSRRSSEQQNYSEEVELAHLNTTQDDTDVSNSNEERDVENPAPNGNNNNNNNNNQHHEGAASDENNINPPLTTTTTTPTPTTTTTNTSTPTANNTMRADRPSIYFYLFLYPASLILTLIMLADALFIFATIVGIPLSFLCFRRILFLWQADITYTSSRRHYESFWFRVFAFAFCGPALIAHVPFFLVTVLLFPIIMVVSSVFGIIAATCQTLAFRPPKQIFEEFCMCHEFVWRTMLWSFLPFSDNSSQFFDEPIPIFHENPRALKVKISMFFFSLMEVLLPFFVLFVNLFFSLRLTFLSLEEKVESTDFLQYVKSNSLMSWAFVSWVATFSCVSVSITSMLAAFKTLSNPASSFPQLSIIRFGYVSNPVASLATLEKSSKITGLVLENMLQTITAIFTLPRISSIGSIWYATITLSLIIGSYRIINLVLKMRNRSIVFLFFILFVVFACFSLMIHFVLSRGFCGMDLTVDSMDIYRVFVRCNKISGIVAITGVESLQFIRFLVPAIGGYLSIVKNPDLQRVTLMELEDIQSNGSLVISSNPVLEEVNMPNMRFMSGSLSISSNQELSLVDISRLRRVMGSITIANNPNLNYIKFSPFPIISGELIFQGNPSFNTPGIKTCRTSADCPSIGIWSCNGICMQVLPMEWFTFSKPFDLQYSQLYYQYSRATNSYSVCIKRNIENLPSPISVGTKLILKDDSHQLVNLISDFSYYATKYSFAYIGSNGYISFDEDQFNTFELTFPAVARLNFLYTDLDPPRGGDIRFSVFSNRFVISFVSISEYYENNFNTVQVEFFYQTSDIRITYLRVDARSVFVGPVQGTILPSKPIDLSQTNLCTA